MHINAQFPVGAVLMGTQMKATSVCPPKGTAQIPPPTGSIPLSHKTPSRGLEPILHSTSFSLIKVTHMCEEPPLDYESLESLECSYFVHVCVSSTLQDLNKGIFVEWDIILDYLQFGIFHTIAPYCQCS